MSESTADNAKPGKETRNLTDEPVFVQQIVEMLKAGYPGIHINHNEPLRIEAALGRAAWYAKRKYKRWTTTEGWKDRVDADPDSDPMRDPMEAVNAIGNFPTNGVFVMHLYDEWFRDPTLRQLLRDATDKAETAAKCLVLVGDFRLPGDLEKRFTPVEFAYPDRADLETVVSAVCTGPDGRPIIAMPKNGTLQKCIDAALGLTVDEAKNAFALSIIRKRELCPEIILSTKRDIVKRSGILEYVETKESLDGVGGLQALKAWLVLREQGFSKKAREYGLEPPKGLLLVGIPGCGKSHISKACASAWRIPLLKLDMGRIFGSLVGQSEAQLRSALKTAEALAPCVLFIDEFEKATAGMGGSSTDGGTTQRVMGSLLTWMQDRPQDKPVFVVATANNIGSLPPEMLRKGRWDEIFFVDLPDAEERKAILKIHLAKRDRAKLATKDILTQVADVTDGYTGAEIEEIVKAALWRGFAESREIDMQDLIDVAQETVPLKMTMKTQIEDMRSWASGRARHASKDRTDAPVIGSRTIQVD